MSRVVVLILSVVWMLIGTASTVSAQSNDPAVVAAEQRAFHQAVAVVEPSVVQVQTVGGTDRAGEIFIGGGPSTGLVVDSEGYIVTSAFRFATKPSSVLVRLGDGRSFPAEVIATDHLRKLTLLKIDVTGLPTFEVSPREELKAGQWSIAIGRTYQVEVPNVSVGIISAVDRVWGKAIQTDAKISPVNYGGPMVDIDGRVQGLLVPMHVEDEQVTAGVEIYDSGIGFAVPMDDVIASVERLKAGKDLRQGMMGVQFKAQGFQGRPYVSLVRQGSPAETAGLKSGDLITGANGQAVANVADFKQVVGRLYGGDPLKIKIDRDGKSLDLDCLLVEELAPYQRPFLGIVPQRELADSPKDQQGTVIRAVIAGSPADKAGLKTNDVLLNVGGTETTKSAFVATAVTSKRVGDEIEVRFLRDGKEQTVPVTLSAESAAIPEKLPAVVVGDAGAEEDRPKVGVIRKELPGYGRSYWVYVPEQFPKDFRYGVVMWLHPPGMTMQEELLASWTSVCNQRGLILLAPLAEENAPWTADDLVFVGDCLGDLEKTYRINESNMALHLHEKTTSVGLELLALKSVMFQGVILVDNTTALPALKSTPERELMFLLVSPKADAVSVRFDEESARKLSEGKIPVEVMVEDFETEGYPKEESVDAIGRWVDSLDRI